jgi:AcrR family transcriptional regulator
MYKTPKQSRAKTTETNMLDALSRLLRERSLHDVTVHQICEASGASNGAFMTRFGSKRAALGKLFQRFCDDVLQTLSAVSSENLSNHEQLQQFLEQLSTAYEALVCEHWGANRAMHEVFLKEGIIDDQTKNIFRETVTHLHPIICNVLGANWTTAHTFSSVQLLVTINYNFALGAMPGLPADAPRRHRMISGLLLSV